MHESDRKLLYEYATFHGLPPEWQGLAREYGSGYVDRLEHAGLSPEHAKEFLETVRNFTIFRNGMR